MIHSLSIKNWPVHGNKEFVFETGVIAIQGPNESGKSLIFEAISFCLHGASALRRPAKDYKGIQAVMVFTVNGVKYTIDRSLKSALLTGPNDLIVSGTTPVNLHVVNMFGYGSKVFNVANLCRQDDIPRLALMSGAERKSTINNLIGLEPVEKTLATYKHKLSGLRSEMKGLTQAEPEKRTPIDPVDDSQIERINEIITAHKRVAMLVVQKPLVVEKPTTELAKFVLATDRLSELRRQGAALDQKIIEAKAASNWPQPVVAIEQLQNQWLAFNNYKANEALKAKGTVVCENCQHEQFLHPDAISDLGPVIKPVQTVAEVMKLEADYAAAQSQAGQLEELYQQQKQNHEARTKLAYVLEQLGDVSKAWGDYYQYEREDAAYQKYCVAHSSAVGLMAVMSLEDAKAKLEALTQQKLHHNLYRMAESYHHNWSKSVAKVQEQMEEIDAVVNGLNILHGTIKSNILPSLNAMASAMLEQMSDGKHPSIELTEAMDILVDGETIDALSGSGRAVAHLALRLSLGSILTSRAFPVALFDEVDAGMDVKRSGNVMALLASMLDRFKQVFVISHKALENVNQTINL